VTNLQGQERRVETSTVTRTDVEAEARTMEMKVHKEKRGSQTGKTDDSARAWIVIGQLDREGDHVKGRMKMGEASAKRNSSYSTYSILFLT